MSEWQERLLGFVLGVIAALVFLAASQAVVISDHTRRLEALCSEHPTVCEEDRP